MDELMSEHWKKLQKKKVFKSEPMIEKKLKHLKRVIEDPDGYNTNLASKDRVESLEQQIDELQSNSHPPVNFTDKLDELHTKMDGITKRLDGITYLIKQVIKL
mgnify:FL=1|tara:strand:- start:47 stop:355 length:309 start_codon:yes stop_codon:yes gene_type:complete